MEEGVRQKGAKKLVDNVSSLNKLKLLIKDLKCQILRTCIIAPPD